MSGPLIIEERRGDIAVISIDHPRAETHGREYWTPAPLLEEIAAASKTFQAWHTRRAAATGAP